jgi:hypothetical protein
MVSKISSTLNELLKWTKFAGMQQLRIILSQTLETDVEMLIYELSDGTLGTREIARLAGVGSNATVASFWKKWNKIGIVEPYGNLSGRYKHICSLEEVGLTVPQLHSRPSTEVETTQETEQSERNG